MILETMLASDFLSDLSLLSYKYMAWNGQLEGVCTMWLSELGTFAMFWDLKIQFTTETDILWFDLREYVCYCECGHVFFLPLLLWPCLDIYFDYMPCLAHDLPTANRHDHAWTETWAQKSMRCASCSSSWDHDMYIDMALGGVNSAGRTVREQII